MLDQAKKNTGEVEMKSAADIKVCHAATLLQLLLHKSEIATSV